MNIKKGFTLAETLIVLALIGFLAVIMLGSLNGVSPDKKKMMFKKAYEVTERIVGELVNDEELYPTYDRTTTMGFRNKEAVVWPGSNEWYGENPPAGAIVAADRERKFCHLFRKKLNVIDVSANSSPTNCGSFTTSDGIWFQIEDVAFEGNDEATVFVDVDGRDKGNNCIDDPIATGFAQCSPQEQDMFRILVKHDGKVRVGAENTRQYLQGHELKEQR